ncbi:MAG: alpha/beta fold hydrolase [Lachnospiraceae bacterium]|nr:alpha/beta fold hydrolase [Lachnospiraceae bacterium]
MRKKIYISMLMVALTLVVGCSNNASQEKGVENKTEVTSEKKSEKETEKETEKKEETVVVEELIIKDGEKEIYGKIYKPAKQGVYPAIILSHGYNGCNSDFIKECKYYAENGYVAYAYDFCGGSTKSKSSGQSTDMTIFTEKADLITVFNYIKTLDIVNEEEIFLFGGSQGGLVTALACEELKSEVKAMILYYPALNIPDDWRNNFKSVEEIPDTYDFWGLKLGKNFFTSIRDFYTFDNIGEFDKNVLIIHGDKDAIVSLNYSEQAKNKYTSLELVVLPGEGHGFTPNGGTTAMNKVLEFMKVQ